jgi:hypothetical protein
MSTSLLVPSRFNGPPSSANGGYVCGALAELVPHGSDRAVEVSLRLPPPLDTPLTVADGVLSVGGRTVAEARVVDPAVDPVDAVPPDVAAEAMLAYPGLRGHPFPTCFVCGTDRAAGDGLRIFPGPVGGERGHVASVWVPDPSVASPGEPGPARCGSAVTWAALDCIGGWSEQLEGRPYVLGRMTARVDALPVVGEPHVLVGRHLGAEGRKSFTASTMYDADGRVVASARHTWIQVDPAHFG